MGDNGPFWLCDPEKNTECKKTWCAAKLGEGFCRHTMKKEYAKDGAEPENWAPFIYLGTRDEQEKIS